MIPLLGTVSKSWMAEALGVAFDRRYYFDPDHRYVIDLQCNAFLHEHVSDLNLFFTESNLGQLAHFNLRQVLVGGIQPNMVLGMLVGAAFLPRDDRDADISPAPLAGCALDDLPRPADLLAHDVVRQFSEQISSIKNDPLSELEAIPPFFWDGSGRAAIHGSLTTAQKLFGESVLIDLVASPERAQTILDWVTEVTIALVKHFSLLGGRQVTEIHVGECSACMVSGAVFSQSVVPTITRFGRALGPIRLHSCGTSDHLLRSFSEIEGLHSLDTGGRTSVRAVRAILGRDFRLEIAPLVEDLRSPTPAPLLAWADDVIDQNAGGPMLIVYHLERGYDLNHLRLLQYHLGNQS